jgi:hypothetical protein
MSWTDEQWAAFVSILRLGFASKTPMGPDEDNVYRMLLEHVPPAEAHAAVLRLVAGGQALRPQPGEIMAAVLHDPGTPTFEEMCALVFGSRGALSLKPTPRGLWLEGERETATRELVDAFLATAHPLVRSFVNTFGVGKLRRLPIDEVRSEDAHGRMTDEAKWAKRELKDDWDRHVATWDGREVAAVAAGSTGTGLRRVEPLAALGLNRREITP